MITEAASDIGVGTCAAAADTESGIVWKLSNMESFFFLDVYNMCKKSEVE